MPERDDDDDDDDDIILLNTDFILIWLKGTFSFCKKRCYLQTC